MTRTFNKVLVQAALVAFGVAALTGCPVEPVVPPPEIAAAPRIVSFNATPTRITEPGEISVSWEVADATEVKIIDPARGEISGVDNKASGTTSLRVEGSTLLVLSARNSRGVIDTAAIGIDLESGVEELQFFVSPTEIDAEGFVVVAWSAPGARSVTLTANGVEIDLKGQRGSGSLVLSPLATTTYVLTADTLSREETVVVNPKLIDFSTSSTAVEPGGEVVLSWRTAGATQIQIEEGSRGNLVPAITEAGRVREGSHVDTVPENVDPQAVFSYRLRVTTPAGELEQIRKVYVAGTPHITDFNVPRYARIGETVKLTWTTEQASRIEIRSGATVLYQSPDADRAAAGELELATPTEPTTYTITAHGFRGGVDTAEGTTDPVGAPAIMNYLATPSTLAVGGQPVTLTWNMSGNRHVRVRAIDGLHAYVAEDATNAGSLTVYPNETSDYELEVDNGLGETVSQTVTVTVTTSQAITATEEPPFIDGSDIALTFPGAAQGAQLYGYPHDSVDYRTASPAFIDISNTGEKLDFTSNDNATRQFTPAHFETFVFGERYEGIVSANTNGWVAMTATTATTGSNVTLPSTSTTYPPSLLAAYWDDLVLGNGKVSWEVVGNAPDRILVIQWTDVQIKNFATSSLTFQVQVFQTGVVRYVYKNMTLGGATPTVTIGLQNATKTAGLVHTGGVSSNSDVTFFGPKSAPVEAKAVPGGPFAGFIKTGSAYTRAVFTMPELLLFGTVRLTEVMYRPSVPGAEYVELFNANSFPLELHGFRIENGTQVLTLDRSVANTIVPPGATYVVGKSIVAAENDGLGDLINYPYGSNFDLPDTGATLLLMKGTGEMTRRTYEEADTAPAVARVFDPGLYRISGGTSGLSYFVPCGASEAQTFGTQSPQQRGTPGQITSCDGFVMTRIPASYYDISLDPSSVNLYPSSTDMTLSGTVKTLALTGGAAFPFYGVSYTSLRLSGYGYLVIGDAVHTSGSSFAGVTMPTSSTPNGTIAVFADFLYKNSGMPAAGVFYKFVAENEDPATPDMHWIFQWKHVQNGSTSGDDLNFQIKLFKDGSFEFHYADMISGNTSNYGTGNSAVIWVENPTGTRALFYGAQQPVLTSHMALRFEPR